MAVVDKEFLEKARRVMRTSYCPLEGAERIAFELGFSGKIVVGKAPEGGVRTLYDENVKCTLHTEKGPVIL